VKRSELLRLVCQAMDISGCEEGRLVDKDRAATAVVRPLRILLAEDSPDNRLLIQLYLQDTPHQLTSVEDGKAAVDRFADTEFDLVLMDMQMPVMDGLSATRAIRALERQRGKAHCIPVIALTANARPQDVAMSHQAGCDDHLSKPISKRNLLRAIERMAGSQGSVNETVEIDIPPGLEEHARAYLDRQSSALEPMQTLLEARNFEELRIAAHNLKGTGTSFGFPEVTRIGALMETAAKEEDAETVRQQLVNLSASLERASGQLAATAK
jgi:CheY-like chemotaxis protein